MLDGVFTVPGDGSVDYPAVLDPIARAGYRGWLVVEAEQDPAVAPSAQYANLGYRNLRRLADAQAFAMSSGDRPPRIPRQRDRHSAAAPVPELRGCARLFEADGRPDGRRRYG